MVESTQTASQYYDEAVTEPTADSKSNQKRERALQGSPSGGMMPGSQLQPMSQPVKAKKPRASKNSSGIWMVEKSLDKKNWIPSLWVPTRQAATKAAADATEFTKGVGLHYRVTRYEPVR